MFIIKKEAFDVLVRYIFSLNDEHHSHGKITNAIIYLATLEVANSSYYHFEVNIIVRRDSARSKMVAVLSRKRNG